MTPQDCLHRDRLLGGVMCVLDDLDRFPCNSNKTPACAHWKDDAGRRDRSGWPLVGVPTGRAFDVLDIDPRSGGEDWYRANFDALPLTQAHETYSGGLHLLFRACPDLRCSGSKIAPGVDVRAAGGYIV
jgi:hypothetical protein